MRSDVTRLVKRISLRRGAQVPYSPETAHKIVTRIAEGETLKAICDERFMPHVMTVYQWRKAHSEFESAYLDAQQIGHDMTADECREIADDAEDDFEDVDGESKYRPSNVARAKLRISTRLDILERRDARYSKRQNVTHSGSLSLAALIDESYQAPAIEGQARVVSEDNE